MVSFLQKYVSLSKPVFYTIFCQNSTVIPQMRRKVFVFRLQGKWQCDKMKKND